MLDKCSTDNIIRNKDLLNNIRSCTEEESLEIFTNGSSLELNETGTLKYFPMDGYYHPDSIANILSFKLVTDLKGHYVKMDTENRPGMYVVKGDKELLFWHSVNGLFYCTINELTLSSPRVVTNAVLALVTKGGRKKCQNGICYDFTSKNY